MSDEATRTPERLEALACVLDEIVPPSEDGRLPGAGELGIGGALAARPELWPLLEGGLAALDEIARARGAASFSAAPRADRRPMLEEVGGKAPAFFPTLLAQTFVAYYQDRRVLETLGLGVGAPYPKGYAVAPTDFSILDPVRARPRFFRDPG